MSDDVRTCVCGHENKMHFVDGLCYVVNCFCQAYRPVPEPEKPASDVRPATDELLVRLTADCEEVTPNALPQTFKGLMSQVLARLSAEIAARKAAEARVAELEQTIKEMFPPPRKHQDAWRYEEPQETRHE